MAILSIHGVDLSHGGHHLLHDVTLTIQPGERLCLTGRNGAGKSTLLQIITGEVLPDRGTVRREGETTVARLPQDLPRDRGGTALEVASGGDPRRELEAEQYLTRLGADPGSDLATLSGGARRRVFLAQTLASGADLLLLDEPTNHLDLDAVLWLEDYLLRLCRTRSTAIVFVTHDREFARKLSETVGEIDRATFIRHPCGYDEFIRRRDKRLEEEEAHRARADRERAAEEAWLRRGVKARRTRDEGRVRRLLAMREEYQRRRERAGSVAISIEEAQRSGDLVLTTENLSFSWDQPAASDSAGAAAPLIRDLTTMIMRGDRVGIVGPNGSGKTTLVRLLLGELSPTGGTIRRGTNLAPLYFDQMRDSLVPELSIWDNLGDGYDSVTIHGRKRHLMAYLQDFLFSPDDANKPVHTLSGGERNRLLLAKLFARPSNLLILDEPTNDLDGETLEMLEQILLDYSGTIILVSHDRAFLDNVVTDCLVLTGNGTVVEYAGGYGDWREKEAARAAASEPSPARARAPAQPREPSPARPEKRSWKEERELEALPDRIAELEEEEARIHERLSDPELYRSEDAATAPAQYTARLEEVTRALAEAYRRWDDLERRAPGS